MLMICWPYPPARTSRDVKLFADLCDSWYFSSARLRKSGTKVNALSAGSR